MAQAIDIAADFEDVIINGTGATQVVTVHSDNAVASSITLGQRSLIAISPVMINQWAGTETPPPSQVDVSFHSVGTQNLLINLRSAAQIKCNRGSCRVSLTLQTTAVFLFTS